VVHELSLSSAVLDTVLRHADGRKVNRVDLTVGALRQVVPASLEFYWGIVSRETVCQDARLAMELVEARLACGTCAHREWTLDQPVFRCPGCGGSDVRVLAGEEFLVESIDVEEREAACTAPR
jgi:hydrogenase nickel incorporation protein HypA/HybF